MLARASMLVCWARGVGHRFSNAFVAAAVAPGGTEHFPRPAWWAWSQVVMLPPFNLSRPLLLFSVRALLLGLAFRGLRSRE